MRTAWRELAPWRGALAPTWEAPAAELFRALGAYRDRQTVAASMQQELAAAGSPEPVLRPPGTPPASDPVALVRAAPFQHALLDASPFSSRRRRPLRPTTNTPAMSLRRHAPDNVIDAHLGKLHSRLKRDARRFGELAELERHAVRKRLKRLRYLAELVAPLYRGGRVERFLEHLGPAQDELGRYMDLTRRHPPGTRPDRRRRRTRLVQRRLAQGAAAAHARALREGLAPGRIGAAVLALTAQGR